MSWIVTLGVAAALCVLLWGFRRWRNSQIHRHFADLCRSLHLMGDFTQRIGPMLKPVALGQFEGRTLRIETVVDPAGSGRRVLTRASLGTRGDHGLSATMVSRGLGSGARDAVSTGDKAFDRQVLVRGKPPEALRELLDSGLRENLPRHIRGLAGLRLEGDQVVLNLPGHITSRREARAVTEALPTLARLASRLEAKTH